jgi:hypothetical protein
VSWSDDAKRPLLEVAGFGEVPRGTTSFDTSRTYKRLVIEHFESGREVRHRTSTAIASLMENSGMRKLRACLFAAVGLLGLALEPPASAGASPSSVCRVNDANDIAYLVFWPPLPGTWPCTYGSIEDFAARLGTTGDGTTRQLGVGARIPVWVRDESIIIQAIREGFDTAMRANVAVHFNVVDIIGWEERYDLWNWYDPEKRGYNPDNKQNVEWYDWEGTANKRRYFHPEGRPTQTPHICYNSPTVEKEIGRIVSKVIGPALRKELDKLKRQNKEYLFAGLTVGEEAGFDDYSNIPEKSQIPHSSSGANLMQQQILKMLSQAATLIDEDGAPHSRLGYCSLTNAGYSKSNPPRDVNDALADIIQNYIEFWDKQFVDAGISCSRIYTHVAASPAQDGKNNAPLRVVFNPYARPGWTTYAIGTLQNGFKPLYDALVKHGNPAWGGVEANAIIANPNPALNLSWEKYLAWHYNHGAKFVGINVGTADRTIMSKLFQSAFGGEAMTAFKKFLNGDKLIEN